MNLLESLLLYCLANKNRHKKLNHFCLWMYAEIALNVTGIQDNIVNQGNHFFDNISIANRMIIMELNVYLPVILNY